MSSKEFPRFLLSMGLEFGPGVDLDHQTNLFDFGSVDYCECHFDLEIKTTSVLDIVEVGNTWPTPSS